MIDLKRCSKFRRHQLLSETQHFPRDSGKRGENERKREKGMRRKKSAENTKKPEPEGGEKKA